MTPSQHFSPLLNRLIGASALAVLAACSSSGGIPVTSSPVPVTPTPPPVFLEWNFVPHAGLEVFSSTPQAAVATISPTPSGGLTTYAPFLDLSAGFMLTAGNGDISYPAGPDSRTFTTCTNTCRGLLTSSVTTIFTGGNASPLRYATYGTWQSATQIFDIEGSFGAFATGLATQPTSRPTASTATYGGTASGFISYGGGNKHLFNGAAALSADFAANTIYGAITGITTTQIRQDGRKAPVPISGFADDIALLGGTITGTTFSGSALGIEGALGSNLVFNRLRGATGTFGGQFYGPGASEAAGSFALSASTVSVIGSFGASLAPAGTPAPPRFTVTNFVPHYGLEVFRSTPATAPAAISATPSGSLTTYGAFLDLTAGFMLGVGEGDTSYPAGPAARTYTVCNHFCLGLAARSVTTIFTGGNASTLHYATYGTWQSVTNLFDIEGSFGVFATGLPTEASSRPAAGTATYAGTASGFISYGGGDKYRFNGDAALAADFSANAISGAITGITTTQVRQAGLAAPVPTSGTADNVSLFGGTITGTTFIGSALGVAAAPSGASPSNMIRGATGTFGGQFYGPGAAEAAGSLALSAPNVSVIGSFGAAK